jgi:hypothetical protein
MSDFETLAKKLAGKTHEEIKLILINKIRWGIWYCE